MVMEALTSLPNDDDSDDPDADAGKQLSIDELVKPEDWPEGKNWGTLTIDASCTPADITFPTDLKLLNEARESKNGSLMISATSGQIFVNTVLDMIVGGQALLSSMSPNRRRAASRGVV